MTGTATAPAITRRRALALVAGAMLPGRPALAATPRHAWRGTALGAPAEITLYHPDAGAARRIIAACLAEIERLEAEFSLFRPDSALSRLNRAGRLARPSHDMRRLLGEARRMSRLSRGRFDVTIQPLWRLYADGHRRRPGTAGGPAPADIAAARALVDYRQVEIGADGVRLGRRGMALSLNGIAQGYITDCVADLLRREGLEHVLIDLGELRAIGRRADGLPWRIGLRDPQRPQAMAGRFELDDRALATSGAYGTRFEPGLGHHHIFDPRTGRSGGYYDSVSVLAERAVTADALSTALYLTPPGEAAALVRAAGPGVSAYLLDAEGARRRIDG